MKKKQWVGVDFDGTLAVYDGWKGPYTFGDPIQNTVDLVKKLLSEETEVRIFTARASSVNPLVHVCLWIWTYRVFGRVIFATCKKDQNMKYLVDDSVRQVGKNSGLLYDDWAKIAFLGLSGDENAKSTALSTYHLLHIDKNEG